MATIVAISNSEDIAIPSDLQKCFKLPYMNYQFINANLPDPSVPGIYSCYLRKVAPVSSDRVFDIDIDAGMAMKLSTLGNKLQDTFKEQFPQEEEHIPPYFFALASIQIWLYQHVDRVAFHFLKEHICQLEKVEETSPMSRAYFKLITNSMDIKYHVLDFSIEQERPEFKDISSIEPHPSISEAVLHMRDELKEMKSTIKTFQEQMKVINQNIEEVKTQLQTPTVRNWLKKIAQFLQTLQENPCYILTSLGIGGFIAISGLVASWMAIHDKIKQNSAGPEVPKESDSTK